MVNDKVSGFNWGTRDEGREVGDVCGGSLVRGVGRVFRGAVCGGKELTVQGGSVRRG